VIFIADENVAVRAARVLDAFDSDNEIHHLTRYFERGTADLEWITKLAQWDPRPVVLCADSRILRNKAERSALREADLMFVHLSRGWTNTPWEQ